jgi:hypothetical protein
MNVSIGDVVIIKNERNLWLHAEKLNPESNEVVASGWFPAACVSQPETATDLTRAHTVQLSSSKHKTAESVTKSVPGSRSESNSSLSVPPPQPPTTNGTATTSAGTNAAQNQSSNFSESEILTITLDKKGSLLNCLLYQCLDHIHAVLLTIL